MGHSIGRRVALALACAVCAGGLPLLGCTHLSTQDRGHEERAAPIPGTPPPKFAAYKTPLTARVVDHRFLTVEAMYLASEMQIGSFDFFEGAIEKEIAKPNDRDFQYMTTVESYWYSRYNMSALVTESRLGLHLVHGPYVSDWALREGRGTDNRDRTEYVRSNKGVLLQEIVPMYQERTGFPRRFEDASPCMLQYASGDPCFPREVDKGTGFESTENILRDQGLRKLYGDSLPARPSGMGTAGNEMWKYRVNYRENFLTLRWDHDGMEPAVDLGAEGQTLMKEVLWMEYFFRGAHHDGRYLGNDPEEGFRGCMLNLMAVSKMLMLKGAMLYDGHRLTGVDPRKFEPGKAYFPHRIGVNLRLAGDLPPRPEAFHIADDSSQLFDQASLLWGLSEYYYFADPSAAGAWRDGWSRVFGRRPPYDGSVMEQKYAVLAEALAGMVLKNIATMHRRPDGSLVSTWRPGHGAEATISTRDLGMAMVALANYARRLGTADPESAALAREMLKTAAAEMSGTLRDSDGSFAEGFDFDTQKPCPGARSLLAQAFAVRGLLGAHQVLGDGGYRKAALDGYSFMNRALWDGRTGVYRSEVGAGVAVYTPMNLGAVLGAMREVILLEKDAKELERFKRFWVQGVDSSGIQQREYEETGERDFSSVDADGDGILRMDAPGGCHGHGIAPVYASRVEIQTATAQAP